MKILHPVASDFFGEDYTCLRYYNTSLWLQKKSDFGTDACGEETWVLVANTAHVEGQECVSQSER